MKRFITAIALTAIACSSYAQDVNKMIRQDDVERIIKTLSADDMQGRATFTPGIEKAAQFIEGEFKQIGLQPLKGDAGYRQNFTIIRSKAVKTLVSINGKVIPGDSAVVITSATNLNWTNNADVQIVKLDGNQNFQQEYLKYTSSGKKLVVLVDPVFTAIFARIVSRANRGSINFAG